MCGLLAAHLGHHDEAETYLQQAVEIARKFDNDCWTAHSMAALAALREDKPGMATARRLAARAGIKGLSADFIRAPTPTRSR